MAMHVILVDPAGVECPAGSPTELTDLLALGYRLKGHGTAGFGADVQPTDKVLAPRPAPPGDDTDHGTEDQ